MGANRVPLTDAAKPRPPRKPTGFWLLPGARGQASPAVRLSCPSPHLCTATKDTMQRRHRPIRCRVSTVFCAPPDHLGPRRRLHLRLGSGRLCACARCRLLSSSGRPGRLCWASSGSVSSRDSGDRAACIVVLSNFSVISETYKVKTMVNRVVTGRARTQHLRKCNSRRPHSLLRAHSRSLRLSQCHC